MKNQRSSNEEIYNAVVGNISDLLSRIPSEKGQFMIGLSTLVNSAGQAGGTEDDARNAIKEISEREFSGIRVILQSKTFYVVERDYNNIRKKVLNENA